MKTLFYAHLLLAAAGLAPAALAGGSATGASGANIPDALGMWNDVIAEFSATNGAVFFVSVQVASPAGPSDPVLESNAALTMFLAKAPGDLPPHVQARALAMMHAAIQDAIIDVGRTERIGLEEATRSAVAVAAEDVLEEVLPFAVRHFRAIHTARMAAIPDGLPKTRGSQHGRQAATAVIVTRANDRWPVAIVQRPGDTAALADLLRAAPAPGRAKPETDGTWQWMKPFGLKRATQFAPEPPYFAYDDGVVLPNDRLLKSAALGAPSDFDAADPWSRIWRHHPIVAWNCVAQALARQREADCLGRARVFRRLNAALADALLAASHWGHTYAGGRAGSPIRMAPVEDPAGLVTRHAVELEWTAPGVQHFPDPSATLAGAAQSVLGRVFGDGTFTFGINLIGGVGETAGGSKPRSSDLQSAARDGAWAAYVDRQWGREACIAGYELGRKIGAQIAR